MKRLSFKSLKCFAAGSRETDCFDAVLCFDGEPIMRVSNDGGGGPMKLAPLEGQSHESFMSRINELLAYGATLPKRIFHGRALDWTIDYMIGTTLSHVNKRKRLLRRLKTHMLFTCTDKAGLFEIKRQLPPECRDGTEELKAFKAKRSIKDLLNILPEDTAFALFESGGTSTKPLVSP